MSNAIARLAFAAVSLLLTGTLAIASTSAHAEPAAPQMKVRYADLDLSNAAGRETLEHRLRIAASNVCADAGSPLQMLDCRRIALANAHAALRRTVGAAS